MKKKWFIAVVLCLCMALMFALAGCGDNNGSNSGTGGNGGSNGQGGTGSEQESGSNSENTASGETLTDRYLNVRFIANSGNYTFQMTIYNNSSALYLLNHIPGGEMGSTLEDNNSFAHYTSSTLRSCPTNATAITSIKAGDVYLASNGQLRMYFVDMNSVDYSMTKIGYIEDTTGLTDAVNAAYERGSNYWGGVYDVYYMFSIVNK